MLADVNGDVQSEGSVMSIFDLLYREYCRARLAEMRKQVLTPVASDEILEAHGDGGDQPRRTKPQPSGSLTRNRIARSARSARWSVPDLFLLACAYASPRRP